MGNLFFAFPNFADAGYQTPVLSGGGWLAALPVANLQDRLLSKVARSASAAAADTWFHYDLGTDRDVRAVVVPTHNLSRAARVRTRAARQIAWQGVTLAATATAGATSLTVQCPGGSAMLRAGDTFRLPGNDTVYALTSALGLGANRARNTEDFSAGGYGIQNCIVVADAATAPDGTATADRYVSGTNAQINVLPATEFEQTDSVVLSVFVRESGYRALRLYQGNGGAFAQADFDLSAGTVHATASGGGAVLNAAGIEALPDDWFRCHLSVANVPAGPLTPLRQFRLLDNSFAFGFTGDGSGVFLWGAQLETGLTPTVYKRGGATAPSAVASGTVTVAPAVAATTAAGQPLTALCGEFVSTPALLDTGWQELYRVVYPFGTLPWGHPSLWDGRVSEEDRADYPTPYLYIHPAAVTHRYGRVDVSDPTNPAGYVELSRLFVSRGYQPSRNFKYGAQLGWRTDTATRTSLGGARFHDRRRPYRVLSLGVDGLPHDEAMARVFDMLQKLGVDGQVFVSMDPDDDAHRHRRSFLATLAALQPVDYAAHEFNSCVLELEEVIA